MTFIPPAPGSSTTTHAVVHAGHRATAYARAGSGAPVVLLLQEGEAAAPGAAIFDALASRFRVFAPECDGTCVAGGASFSGWLRAFLDGLGLPRVRLVVGQRLGVAALGFALLDPDRVERLALVHDDAPDPEVSEAALRERLGGTGLPILLVRLGGEAGGTNDALLRLAGFLATDGADG